MTDLTEREKQIVAWLREQAEIGNHHMRLAKMKADEKHQRPEFWAAGVVAITNAADAIERGEPWKDNNDG